MSNEEDPKETIRKERKTPQTERLLRQFLSLESGNYASAAYRAGYDAAMRGSAPRVVAARCRDCDYVANTFAEADWHGRQCPKHGWL